MTITPPPDGYGTVPNLDDPAAVLIADKRAILTYLAGHTEPVSLRGMLGPDKAVLPREDFDRDDWARWTELYFAVTQLAVDGMVRGALWPNDEHPNRFAITAAGREALAAITGEG